MQNAAVALILWLSRFSYAFLTVDYFLQPIILFTLCNTSRLIALPVLSSIKSQKVSDLILITSLYQGIILS